MSMEMCIRDSQNADAVLKFCPVDFAAELFQNDLLIFCKQL